jgi:hypothetical protein
MLREILSLERPKTVDGVEVAINSGVVGVKDKRAPYRAIFGI